MSNAWFLIQAGIRSGPFADKQLRQLAAEGRITAKDQIWKEGMGQPVSCDKVRGLLPSQTGVKNSAALGTPRPTNSPSQPTPPPVSNAASGPACAQCGAVPSPGDLYCTNCGARITAQHDGADAKDVAIGLLVPHKVSGLAVAAGYLGLFSIILAPAPFALILGVLALLSLRQNPGQRGYGRAIFGIVMGAIFSIIGLITLAMVFLS